jgi:hypothetical protein
MRLLPWGSTWCAFWPPPPSEVTRANKPSERRSGLMDMGLPAGTAGRLGCLPIEEPITGRHLRAGNRSSH